MTVDLDREDLLNLLRGSPPQREIEGLTKFTGNQHNESWVWDEQVLAKHPDEMLLVVYRRRARLGIPPEPPEVDANGDYLIPARFVPEFYAGELTILTEPLVLKTLPPPVDFENPDKA